MAVHLFKAGDGYTIWADTEPGQHHTGRCIGLGFSIEAAKADALAELQADVLATQALTAADAVEEPDR